MHSRIASTTSLISRRSVLCASAILALTLVNNCRSAEIPPEMTAGFTALDSRAGEIRKSVENNPALANDAYVKLGLAVAARFRTPVPGGPPGAEAEWAELQNREVAQVLDWTEQRIGELQHGAHPVSVPRPVGGRLEIRDGLIYARTQVGGSGDVTRRPYWFSGYMNYAAGAYNTTTNMLTDWPDFGATLLQNAPSLAFLGPDWKPVPNKYTGRYDLNDLPEVLQKAADNGVMLDLAVAPHVMPDWAVKDALDVWSVTPAGNLIAYNIDHPKTREVIERWLRMYVPVVKDSPGLFSFYMSNEPSYLNSGRDQWSRPLWIEWLRKTHSTIAALNTLYGTDYQSFDQVPVPAPTMPEGIEARRAYYDWSTFNDQHFADWHGWINGIIKSIAPQALTHVKAYRTLDIGTDTAWGAGPPNLERLSEVTDLADIDAWPCVPAHEGPDEYWWRSQSLNYDLLHSFRGQPVFDSENHIVTVPYEAKSILPAQTQAAVWQGAMHHRSAVALFVWESWTDGDSRGMIYFRPANIYAAGRAMLDMNRLGRELATINVSKPKVALLYSLPAVFWERDYSKILRSAYTALTFMGQPVTFVSEGQLASGKFSSANAGVDWIVVTRATHVTDAAVAGLEKFVKRGGRVLLVGTDCLAWDQYHRPRQLSKSLQASTRISAYGDERAMTTVLKPALLSGGLSIVRLTAAQSLDDVWGVEYRVVPDGRDLLVPMVSYNGKPETVKLDLPGKAIDLLNGKPVDTSRISLDPMVPRLLRVRDQ